MYSSAGCNPIREIIETNQSKINQIKSSLQRKQRIYNAELLAFTSSSEEVINIYNQKSIAFITQPEIYMHKLKRFLAARKKSISSSEKSTENLCNIQSSLCFLSLLSPQKSTKSQNWYQAAFYETSYNIT